MATTENPEQSTPPVKTDGPVTKPGDTAGAPASQGDRDQRGGERRGFGGPGRGGPGGPGRGGPGRGGPGRGGPRGRGQRREPPPAPTDAEGNELTEKVVFINRCAKVVKGGRRFSFSALVVCGNRKGSVGFGFGKAKEVIESIRKASEAARKDLKKVNLVEGTLPHEVYAEFGGGKVLLKPASPGTGVIAGGGVRAVCEVAGVRDVLAKSLGSNNHGNVVRATLKALSELRTREEVLASRGKKLPEKKAI